MGGIWGDGWFYLSAAGFLVSFVLFLFLLGQYRSAVEADDGSPEPEKAPRPSAPEIEPLAKAAPVVTPIVTRPPEPEPKSEKTLVLPAAEAAKAEPPKPEPVAAAPAPAPAKKNPDATISTGGVSRGELILNRIYERLDKFDKEISSVKQSESQQAAMGEAILQRLAALADELADLKASQAQALQAALQSAHAPPAPAPAPEAAAPVVEPPPEPVVQPPAIEAPIAELPVMEAPAVEPAKPEPAPAPEAAPVPESLTIERFVPPPVAAPAPAPSPAPAPAPSLPKQTAPMELKLEAPPVVLEQLPQAAEPAPPGPAREPAPDLPKPRKGPVWPV